MLGPRDLWAGNVIRKQRVINSTGGFSRILQINMSPVTREKKNEFSPAFQKCYYGNIVNICIEIISNYHLTSLKSTIIFTQDEFIENTLRFRNNCTNKVISLLWFCFIPPESYRGFIWIKDGNMRFVGARQSIRTAVYTLFCAVKRLLGTASIAKFIHYM